MSAPIIKVCGLTSLEDARHALAAGASALGFVAVPKSPRAIEPAAVARIVAELPADAFTVLVLVEPDADRVVAAARAAGTTAVQLCGAERPGDLANRGLRIWRRVGVDDGAADEIAAWRELAEAFVLDHPAAPGGTGRTVDLEQAAALARSAPCILAGGLDGDRVADAIAAVAPRGVDASSRLERTPGRKDPAKVDAFVARARAGFGV